MRGTDFMEPIPRERGIPAERKSVARNRLLDEIEHDRAGDMPVHGEARARRRITVVAAVLLSLLGVGAAWALMGQPEQTTRILCPENMVIAAVSGDPVADCAAALEDVGVEPPEMVAYTNEAGAVTVKEAGGEVPGNLRALGEGFRQDTAIIELEATLADVTRGLVADCYTTEEAIPVVENALDRVGLDWAIDVVSEADGESRCAYGFPQPETSSVGLTSMEAELPSEDQPWTELGRQLSEALDAECLNLAEATAIVERLAEDLGMEEMSSISQTTDEHALCTRATVTVGGAVFVDLRGPSG